MARPKRYRSWRERRRLVFAYRRLRSRTAVARELGTTKETVKRVLIEENEPLVDQKTAQSIGHARAPKIRSFFGKWLLGHEWVKFKRSPKEIARIAGVTERTVTRFFDHHRKRLQRELQSLPDLRGLDLELQDTTGSQWPTSFIRTYRYGIDRYSFQVTIHATMINGVDRDFKIADISAFEKICKDANQRN